MEEDYFYINNNITQNKLYVLIIYDIIDNKRRNKLASFLMGYGFRIQKSTFEAFISTKLYQKLLSEIGQYATKEDNIRVYKIMGKEQVTNFGGDVNIISEEIIII